MKTDQNKQHADAQTRAELDQLFTPQPKGYTMIDYTAFTLNQLLEIQDELPRVIAKRQREGLAEAKRAIQQIADSIGVPLDEILNTPTPKFTRPAKYRHPADPALTWTGSGRAPHWVIEWEAMGGGKSREDLRIKGE